MGREWMGGARERRREERGEGRGRGGGREGERGGEGRGGEETIPSVYWHTQHHTLTPRAMDSTIHSHTFAIIP